jgi:hypothetical protein
VPWKLKPGMNGGAKTARGQEGDRSTLRQTTRYWLALLVVLLLATVIVWCRQAFVVQSLPAGPLPVFPTPSWHERNVELIVPGYTLTATVAEYHDELFAFLMFDYLRRTAALGGSTLMLTFDHSEADALYRILVRAADNVITALSDMVALENAGTLQRGTRRLLPTARVEAFTRQTSLFESAYNLPVKQKMEHLPRAALNAYLRRFIRFKSATDPRIRRRLEPIPTPLSSEQAQHLAGGILTIAEFYALPLDFFLGIGAMENNYMNVRGDLKHSIWKRRPAPDDVVLERRGGRVRVLNDSAGVWQITRETLRYAHILVGRDKRDYSLLPEHLRPPAVLKMNEVSPPVLTTYAGVLLRDLLDRFEGDVNAAVSAYNGGPANPNFRYGEGVRRAAEHARKVVEQAAVLNGETVVRMTWLRNP